MFKIQFKIYNHIHVVIIVNYYLFSTHFSTCNREPVFKVIAIDVLNSY